MMSKASQRAYQAIRDAILSGRYLPGARLTEEELAALSGVSRTPVRDALRLLASELYVTMVPNHGTFVTDWTLDDIVEIFELRSLLEGHGAARAALRAGPEQIAALEEQVRIIDGELAREDAPDLDRFLAANRRFHDLITEAADSARLSAMVHRLVQPPVVARTATRYRRSDLARSNAHHRELIEAFRARDPDWARAVMTAHIRAGLKSYIAAQRAHAPS